MILKTALLEPK